MCGRFTITVNSQAIQQVFPWLEMPPAKISPRYNIAPSQPIAIIPNDGKNKLDFYTWGLIPSWAKDPSIGSRLINARSETADEKPSFRSAFKRKRCLILADGFYEWTKQPGENKKTPYYFQLVSKAVFAFAGLWESWWAPDGSEIKSATILTTEANSLVAKVHQRMPVILPLEKHAQWLATDEQPLQQLKSLLRPYPQELMQSFPVSNLVNNPLNELPACILPQSA